MLYLFNSAYRAGFTTNVLNTLYLPKGCVNKYRYTVGRNVDSSICDRVKLGDELIIVFIDRYGEEGYRFHPLREGELHRCYPEGDHIFFEVKLLDYVYPKNLEDFQDQIKRSLDSLDLPRLTRGDRQATDDGTYAIPGAAPLRELGGMISSDSAWTSCVDQLHRAKAFIPDAHNEYLFLRATIQTGVNQGHTLDVEIYKGIPRFSLTAEGSYCLRLFYKYPPQQTDSMRVSKVSIEDENNVIVPRVARAYTVDKLADEITFTFSVTSWPRQLAGQILANTQQPDGLVKTHGPDVGIPYRVKQNIWRGVMTLLAILLMGVSGAALGLDILTGGWHVFVKIAAAALQASAIYYLYWRLGHKVQ